MKAILNGYDVSQEQVYLTYSKVDGVSVSLFAHKGSMPLYGEAKQWGSNINDPCFNYRLYRTTKIDPAYILLHGWVAFTEAGQINLSCHFADFQRGSDKRWEAVDQDKLDAICDFLEANIIFES